VHLNKGYVTSFKARVSQIISKHFSSTYSICSFGDIQIIQPVQLRSSQHSEMIQVAIVQVL